MKLYDRNVAKFADAFTSVLTFGGTAHADNIKQAPVVKTLLNIFMRYPQLDRLTNTFVIANLTSHYTFTIRVVLG